MVSILLGVWNGGGVCCCCPAQCSGVARALLIPLQCWRVLQLMSYTVAYRVWCCGVVQVRVCTVRVVGYPLSTPPLVVVDGGAIVDGGWHGEGRASVLLTPHRMAASPVYALASPLSFTLWPY